MWIRKLGQGIITLRAIDYDKKKDKKSNFSDLVGGLDNSIDETPRR